MLAEGRQLEPLVTGMMKSGLEARGPKGATFDGLALPPSRPFRAYSPKTCVLGEMGMGFSVELVRDEEGARLVARERLRLSGAGALGCHLLALRGGAREERAGRPRSWGD
jgi:hypothetical protein